MSIDGRFSLSSAFERFLTRCPKLGCILKLKSLSQKGDKLVEEEIVNSIAELFLHPNYTIPMIGCFRPIARKIVNKSVELLRLVPSLKSNSEDAEMETGDEDDNYVIEFYVRSGKGLKLHELACLAFSRALDLAPFLLNSVLSYFSFAPPPFQRLLATDSASQLILKDGTHLLDAVRATFRLLLVEPQVFSELWDWSSFLDLVYQSANVNSGNDTENFNNALDVRWCATRILYIVLKMSDRANVNFGLDAEKSLTSLLRWEEFCQDVSMEKAGWYLETTELGMGVCVDGNMDFNQEYCLQSVGLRSSSISSLYSHEFETLRKDKKLITWDVKSVDGPFVLTSAVKKSFDMVLLAVSQKWPVLLYGPTGAGKTAMINKLAQISEQRVLSIHMDEQMDGKTLIGSYVCTEQPGEFRWQPGSLTQAVLNGFWVVFEDIDKAPSDVHSILLPLLEGVNSFVTGRGEAIGVAESFRLFSTISSSKNDISHNSEGRISLGVLWRRVMIGPSGSKDFLDILNAWYPNLEGVAEKLIETFERVNSTPPNQLDGSQSFSRFSLRDLLKWCKRITGLGFSFLGLSLSAYECKSIYQEAVDIFAASSSSCENRLSIMKEISKIWGVPAIEAETLFPPNKPIIQDLRSDLRVGRITLERPRAALHHQTRPFANIRSSLHVLERIACSVKYNEPALLVGETGTGKTTLVQNLAMRLGRPLTVLNLSQQSDVTDLLGGLKPTDPQFICIPLYNEFMELFSKTFSVKDNMVQGRFLDSLRDLRTVKNWKKILKVFQKSLQKVIDYFPSEAERPECGTKRKRSLGEEVQQAWESFSVKLQTACRQIDSSAGVAFSFVEGAFVTALRNGHWILLDEVNLAPPETLQRVMGVLEGEKGSLCLAERGDVDYIDRHPDFRLFACMNPATDVGKRDLPYSLRSRFTEYVVDEVLDDEDLTLFINQFIDDSRTGNKELVKKIVHFYKTAKKESEERLQDGANQKPQFSLRSLYRALEYMKKAERKFGFQKALYDGFCMFFLTMLDKPSAKIINNMILKILGEKMPRNIPFDDYLVDLKLSERSKSDTSIDNYILTSSVKEHLRNLARALLIKRYPVLLQGPTSSGKTSLVHYLASITGHEFVRINNHEHTDLQEYLGSYVTDPNGKLVFQEGVLVKAVRNGSWIVLDELNLAPSDVLEALNRLLDDNRELFVPELQETVHAHPNFMLFATQNPPTFYGGRKMLSRAFRNRFVEIHVDEIPEDEISMILEKRCKIPESYARKMVDVMKDLQLHRQSSKVFAGKHGFITPRDLFRWADRFRTLGKSYEDLAKDGYFLLAERLRDESEKNVVQEILERRLRVKLGKDNLYMQDSTKSGTVLKSCDYTGVSEHLGSIMWTRSMWRLYFLVERCYKLREPVLLVGETGGGKTTVCQLLSIVLRLKLHILNCHQYTETSDFLGGFYPVRDRSRLSTEFRDLVEQLMSSNVFLLFPGSITLSYDIGEASSMLDHLNIILNSYRHGKVSHPDVTKGDLDAFEKMKLDLVQLHQKWHTIFTWLDGPLLQAMKGGDLFLVDEISLADDSVLERLNSVLEPERKLSLAEKGGAVLEKITAHPNFFLLATMNPGGDYGKKELSPALRNRFTEIWVTPVSDLHELQSIAVPRFVKPTLSYIVDPMLKFWEWFNQLQTGRMLTVRDLLSWVDFINVTDGSLGSYYSFLHGVFLILLDGLTLGTGISRDDAEGLRERCLSFILECLKMGTNNLGDPQISKLETYGWGNLGNTADIMSKSIVHSDHLFGINPFYIRKGVEECRPEGFEFLAPNTCRNAMRVLRAMQLSKPVLLEGSPGVGKTSLIVALGKFSGHKVVRINLSEQTDIMDLLGSDLPVEDAEGMKFAWSDGILLQALKNGNWVLLDELNLAPQSVLEGLNAILDHRAEVFIPELGITFKCPPSFRVFACQNPFCQGGGRKGLPKSFLNRFTKVYVDELFENDYHSICCSLYPSIPRLLLSKLIHFNKRLYEDTMLFHKFGQDGSPWEFNLRDVIRSCQIIEGAPEKSKVDCFLSVVYIQRMRTEADRREVLKLYEEVFGVTPFINPHPQVQMNPQYLTIGNAFIERHTFQPHTISKSQLNILPGSRQSLEAVVQCVQNQWLCILVGPSSSGKTSLVRVLAHLTGNVLNELNLSSATDISELLGCFEQYNAFRNFRSAIALVEMYIGEYFSLSLESTTEEVVLDRKGLVSKWSAFLSTLKCSPTSSSTSAYAESWKSGSYSSMDSLVQIIEQLKLGLVKYQLPTSWSAMDLDKILKTILDLQENNRKQIIPAKFEWVTGLLIKAIECGEWVVLENANLCNPTVLDRINSLVEPSGSITVNECGLVDGKPMVVHPHKKFRLFLTVNPRYGEVSRAMRNRGVEVFMMQPHWLYGVEDGHARKETEIRDVKRFLVLSGIPIDKLVDIMAESHMFARDTGVSLGIQITLLELTRWVQLLQQLLMNGNKLVCSLQLSWEHTYLSSLGEAEGRDAVEHAKNTFLSASNLSKLDALLGYSLSLPGGWPTPLKLRNFMLWSKEACIKQNCMYLEFLGAQCASYELSVDHSGHVDDRHLHPSLIPLHKLHHILFPTTSNQVNFRSDNLSKFDLALANKMLFFAANWTMERAIEGDVKLYLLWFSWFSSRLQPYCRFFNSYLAIIEQEMDHVIWKYIVDCRRELISHFQINVNMHPLPMLSLKLMEWTSSNEAFKMLNKRLYNAIQCVGLLRLSFQQWNAEDDHNYNEEAHLFIPLLESLRELERVVLNKLVDSPCFEVLFQLYSNLLEDHTSFWNGIISTQLEFSVLSWRSLKKNAIKLRGLFPKAVKTLLVESRNLGKELPWNFHSPKSMLWVHGGHPFLPSSAEIYSGMLQLLRLCKLIWPAKTEAWKQCSSENDCFVKSVISADSELRSLAMQGVCMSSYFIRKDGQDDAKIVQQLEEMHQMLLGRFDHEKHKLEAVLVSDVHACLEENSTACCAFCPEKLCYNASFDSWKETLPLFDGTSFFLDMEILKELSNIILVDANELFSCLSNASEILEFAMDFSLKFSSRSPLDFVPHQTLLWTLDSWNSVDSVHTNVASSILDMWFRWHSFLWTYCPEPVKIDGCDMPLPYMLFQPTKTATLDHILQGAFPIKDYTVHCLKLRAASGNVWQDSPPGRDLPCILLSAAQSLFQQIIAAHRKSFDEEKYSEIKSIFCSIQGNQIKQEKLQDLSSLIASSSHSRLISLMDLFIEPLLKELYLQHSSHDFLYNLAHAWLHIGGLRFHLLLALDDLDPAMKYSFKHSQLVTKISLLELEIKVRQECDHLAGSISTKDDLNQRAHLIEKLEMERRRLERKIVFRHGPAKFTKLKSECAEFLRLVTSSILTKNVEVMNVSQMIEQAFNWQETATGFINQLTDDYAAYVDICQPVQVATYEMKLGLSLLVSSALQKAFLGKIDENTTDHILETIYCFMRFPRDASADDLQLDLLKKLCISPRDSTPDKMVSVLQRHAAVHVNILVRITYNVCNSLVMETTSFKLLNEIFDQFAGLWMSMKVQTKAKHEEESQNYKFKPRAFKIEDIFEVDISTLRNTTTDESLCLEWQEMLAEDETTELAPAKEHENLEEEWNLIQESILKTMVHVHNQFFGESNMVERPGIVQISDADKLFCFLDSYRLGMGMLKDLPALLSSSLDAKLMPEHLLHLCLDYEEKFGLSFRPALVYNIYKDSNAPVMAKMVKPLTSLQQRVLYLLNDWPEHPGLQKILDVTKLLLAIPLSTPLAKALSGLQFLLSKARMLEESAPKFSLSDHLQPIFLLVSSWQKMELDSWPALLDGVQEQYEINCGKLWLPLYSVLHREQTDDIAGHNRSTIKSLEEFIQTSSIGEFKTRLQLLLAFHGQINIGLRLKFYLSPSMMENLKILYNVFGYYEQFLAIATEHIEANKRTIAADLKELVKLSRWDRPDSYLSIETSKRTRQKLRKLIQKFNDILQQPVMVIVNQDIAKRGIKVQSLLGTKTSSNTFDMNTVMMLPVSIDQTLFSDTQRSMWYSDFRKRVDSALQNLCPRMISEFDLQYLCFKDAEEIANTIRQSLTSQSACLGYQEEWKEVWLSLENICRTAIECADLWKDESKSFGKRRALSELLKLLENCGLSRHKSLVSEDEPESNQHSSWFLQPSYDVQHLLLPWSGQPSPNDNSDPNWKIANQYYYKSMAMVQLLREICLNFHKDFSLEQIVRSSSFLNHLIIIQQEQRSVAYGFAEHLKSLRKCVMSLKDLDTNSSIVNHGTDRESCVSPNQHAMHECMWQQKQLFDTLYAFSHEASLLLRKVENTHLNTCQSVKVAANKVLVFIEKFIPNLQISKESLDQYLLGSNRIITTPAVSLPPFVVSKQMEQLVTQNFQEINDFEKHLHAFSHQFVDKRSVREPLLGRYGDILNRGKVIREEFHSVMERRNQSIGASEDFAFSETFTNLETAFVKSFNETLKQIREAFQKLGSSSNGFTLSDNSMSGNITKWKVLVESSLVNMRVDLICEALGETIVSAVELVDHAGNRFPKLCSQMQIYLNHLCVLVDLILTFGDGLLLDFLAMHRTVAEMTHMLAYVFASLYSKGFGGSSEDHVDDTCADMTQDASGTGMGEGAGLNDVSDQINDEDQLLGASEKPSEGQDAPNDVPSKNDKGIEMDQDFAADAFSVSEDSGDDENEDNDEDEKLESAMGETGDDGEVVDEKLWNKEEDENHDNTTNEKYESGPSVKDEDSSSRELRAKEDGTNIDESGELSGDDESNKHEQHNDENQNISDDSENLDDMKMDKDASYADPTGIQLDEKDQDFEEEINLGEPEGSDTMEEAEQQEDDVEDGNNEDGKGNEEDEDMEEVGGSEHAGGNVDGDDDQGKGHDDESAEKDLTAPSKSLLETRKYDFTGDSVPSSAGSAVRPNGDAHGSDSNSVAPETEWSNNSNIQNGFAPSSGLPNDVPQTEIMMPNSITDGKLTADQPKSQSTEHEHDSSSMQRAQPNPYRSVGDALEKWKERVKVSVDSQENKTEAPDDMEDDSADEYGFVSEFEKGTSQAQGPATSDQIDKNIKGSSKPDGDEGLIEQEEDFTEMEVEKQDSETLPVRSYNASMVREKIDEQVQNSDDDDEAHPEGSQKVVGDNDDSRSLSGNLISIKRSYMNEEILQLSNLTVDDDKEMGMAKNLDEVSGEMKDNATSLWRRYELSTTRLSQELAEQLRLVMEPTLASKLQGDYKTGKRINMKKVIPYIASHYRKDKIWLRRTRPNKRDYQVIVAVDDSRSMSESHCGDVAIEALVTVCRAMSQLEVGQLAVASFGKKGNIQLLHDFNQSFTGEAGIKMISSLTFKQENTIEDEPMVDLLTYLNNKLDAAAANARLPSGQNPLQQLMLIIADGRFHEKEKLKRCVRDALNKRRMVAFLLVDSPEESIMDFMEASYEGKKLVLSKYLNSFPFPYYIILKNIEALPRTLADLLRQWFELMQNTRD